jgi:hypothetical protein
MFELVNNSAWRVDAEIKVRGSKRQFNITEQLMAFSKLILLVGRKRAEVLRGPVPWLCER